MGDFDVFKKQIYKCPVRPQSLCDCLIQGDVTNLLYSDKDEIRSMAVAYFALILQKAKLTEFLDEYLSKGEYYYNVVCWIDRILYAPGGYKKMFYRELASKIK